MSFIYLDNAASASIDPEVSNEMLNAMTELIGNPSSIHSAGVEAMKKIEKSRNIIANSLNISDEEVFFTSGGTESNNWVLKSLVFEKNKQRQKVIISSIEHPSINEPLMWLERKGFINLIRIGVDDKGIIKLNELENALDESVLLCSVMHVNNEVGSVQPILEIGNLCQKRGVIFHVDACQSYMKLKIDLSSMPINFLTINSHKIHGPKGVGALIAKKGNSIEPFFHGGGHELGLRSGTLNTAGIVGFGKAVSIQSDFEKIEQVFLLKKWLINELRVNFKNCVINGGSSIDSPNILNIRFDNISARDLFWFLNKNKIYISTSSACSSMKNTPSTVLKEMGLADKANFESIRISLGIKTTMDDLNKLIEKLKEFVL